MNDQTEKNEMGQAEWTLSNILAMAGFVVLVILFAWLAIQFVRMLPTAWDRLATVFEENQRALEEKTANQDDDSNKDDDKKSDDNVVVVDNNEDYIDDVVEDDSKEEDDSKDVATTTPTTTPTPTTGTGTVKPTPTPVQYHTVATYVVPTSDPNGYTDLEITFVAVGRMTAAERFVAGAELEADEIGAMQFRVKNIGTKTSSDWHFEALLTDGDTMKSNVQKPLKPGEMATLTVVFEVGDKDGNRSFGASVYGGNDINSANNGFRSSTKVR